MYPNELFLPLVKGRCGFEFYNQVLFFWGGGMEWVYFRNFINKESEPGIYLETL